MTQKTVKYSEDWSYTKTHRDYPDKGEFDNPINNVHEEMLKYVVQNAQKGNLKSCIDKIDQFCAQHWMMNLGPEKSIIIQDVFKKSMPKKILQLGGYCGYSSLVFSHISKAEIYTVEISETFANIARQVQQHAGVKERNHILIGTVETLKKEIVENGPYDAILIDHAKGLYLSDLKLLQSYGVIVKHTLVLGDNIIFPGPVGYLDNFKQSSDYESVLYHSFVEYSNIPDALLVSQKL